MSDTVKQLAREIEERRRARLEVDRTGRIHHRAVSDLEAIETRIEELTDDMLEQLR